METNGRTPKCEGFRLASESSLLQQLSLIRHMKPQVFESAEAAAREAARFIASEARDAVAARGRFILAISGGHSPALMLRALANEKVPWDEVHVMQVDERVAPAGHPDRNLTLQRES